MQTPDEIFDAMWNQPGYAPCEGVDICEPFEIRHVGDWSHTISVFSPSVKPAEPTPTLVYVHGGGFRVGDPQAGGTLGKYLALAAGMTTVSVGYRFGTPEAPSFPQPIDDIAFAWQWIRENAATYNIDTRRMAIGGGSAGGCLTSLAVTRSDVKDAAALVSMWGPLDFVARWFDNGEVAGAEPNLIGCTYLENPSKYLATSPLTHVSSDVPPALFLYGRQDRVVHARQGALGLAAWQAVGQHAEYYVHPNIGHGIEGDNRTPMMAVYKKVQEFLYHRM